MPSFNAASLSVGFFLLIVPWLATLTGSLTAFKLNHHDKQLQRSLLGFAAGVMFAAAVWSLIIPAFDIGGHNLVGILMPSLGFILGCLAMLGLDKALPHIHLDGLAAEGPKSNFSKPLMVVFAVALHNIPEGLSLGIVMAATLQMQDYSLAAAITFGLGLALQNFPEGMAVTLPLRSAGISEDACRRWSILASFAEPGAALLGWAGASMLAQAASYLMPLLLSVAAGAMVFIVVEELIPESQAEEHEHRGTYGFLLGFWLMAIMGIVAG